MNRRILSLFFVVACAAALTACSGSKAKTDESAEPTSDTTASSADTVGSIPEDALLATEASSAPSDALGAAEATDMPKAEGTTDGAPAVEKDPFADLAAEAAANETATTEEPAVGITTDSYTVKKGDTLMKVAFNLYGDLDRWRDIYEWNKAKLKSGNQLRAGMRLQYENTGTGFTQEKYSHSYLIKKGDTLGGIADEVYGRKKKYKKLQKYNANLIKNPNVIFAGFTLYYDITQQEMAEAEARRKQRMAAQAPGMPSMPQGDSFGGGMAPSIPSAINPITPPMPQDQAPVAIAPSAPAVPVPPPAPASVPAPPAGQ